MSRIPGSAYVAIHGSVLGRVCRNRRPSIPGLKWLPIDPDTNKTMVWDNECRMVNDPEGEARKIILA